MLPASAQPAGVSASEFPWGSWGSKVRGLVASGCSWPVNGDPGGPSAARLSGPQAGRCPQRPTAQARLCPFHR